MPLAFHITGRDVAAELLGAPEASGIGWVVSIGEVREDMPSAFAAFDGPKLRLDFDDIERERHQLGYIGPGADDVEALVAFTRQVAAEPAHRRAPGLVHCGAGISRSAAAVLTMAATLLGPGAETNAVSTLHAARFRTLAEGWREPGVGFRPNRRLVWLADEALGRGGRLLRAVEDGFAYAYGTEPYVRGR